MEVIERMDAEFARYYKWCNRDYHNQFATFCKVQDYNADSIEDDVKDVANESQLVEFDEDFPFKKPPNDEEEKMKYIHQLIRQFYYKIPESYVIVYIQNVFKCLISQPTNMINSE